jgi:hypothetical protein
VPCFCCQIFTFFILSFEQQLDIIAEKPLDLPRFSISDECLGDIDAIFALSTAEAIVTALDTLAGDETATATRRQWAEKTVLSASVAK